MIRSAIFLTVFGIFTSATALADSSSRVCVRDANVEFRSCNRECSSVHEDELLICSAKGNQTLADCFKGCSVDKDTCLKPFQDSNQSCYTGCFSAFDAAMTACETGECAQGELRCKICKLSAKLTRFECAEKCQDGFKDSQDGRRACREAFRGCLKNCRRAK